MRPVKEKKKHFVTNQEVKFSLRYRKCTKSGEIEENKKKYLHSEENCYIIALALRKYVLSAISSAGRAPDS